MAKPGGRGKITVAKLVGATLFIGLPTTEVLEQRLEDIGMRAKDLKPVLDAFGRHIVEEHIPAQFARQGTPRRWAPLSPAYKRWKDKHFPGRPILVRTGAMQAGFRWEAHPRSLRVVNRVMAG